MPSVTDRPRRAGEKETEHRFVTKDVFDQLENENFFVGQIVTPFNLPYRYGLPAIQTKAGKVSLVMTRAVFVPIMLAHYPNTLVYQIEADESFAKENIQKRGDAEIGSRLSKFDAEIEMGRSQAKRIFANNDSIQKLAIDIERAIKQDFLI